MNTSADQAWQQLEPVWQVVFDQAWTSWCDGDFGIGAALLDPATSEIVSVGRNRVNTIAQPDPDSIDGRPISGTFLAHAEMNALATLPRYKADRLHLYTTLEPCLMCAASAILMHVEQVHFAASDELFADLDMLWDQHPYSARYKAERTGPLSGRLASFARVLPLSLSARDAPNKKVMLAAQADTPAIAALATELAGDKTFETLRNLRASAKEVIIDLWPRLPA